MNEKYHCKNCSYFFGKEGIHCAVHPYGKESEYCSDWQQTQLNLQEEKSMNNDTETKSFSYPELAKRILLIGVTLLFGHQLYQNIPPAIRADRNYDLYKIKCEIFLERASNAGTTGVASDELAKGVNWLESNSFTQSFEYKDLKGNLDYLQNQPRNIAMPINITRSISSDLKNIREKQLRLRDEGRPGMGGLADLITLIFILILMLSCLLILVLLPVAIESSEL